MNDFDWKGIRALVTGGAGFVGSHLVDTLVALGARVTVVDDLSAGSLENLYNSLDDLAYFTDADVADEERMRCIFQMASPRVVFHQAASKRRQCEGAIYRDLEVNAKGALVVAELCHEFGVERVVHASTGSVYGWPVEDEVTEMHPMEPLTHYGVSKLAGDRYMQMYHRARGLQTTILRYYQVYGPRQRSADGAGGVVAIFCRRAAQGEPLFVHGNGRQAKTFTWVGDVVKANLEAATRPGTEGRVYNVSSGEQTCVLNLARRVASLAVREVGFRPTIAVMERVEVNEPISLRVNNRAATELVGRWRKFALGLESTFRWYRKRYGKGEGDG